MIRLTWLQFRTQAAVALGLLAVVVVVLAVTGPHLAHLYDTAVAPCKAHGDCPAATTAFLNNDRYLQEGLPQLLLVIPALTGIFWGAPLVARELETGTFRLGWTQSITRTRWLAAKLAVTGLASVAVAGLASLMTTWWASPIDRVNPIPFTVFPERGIAPLGYAAFAFALGVTTGVLIRRTLPAMAITLAAFAAARIAVTELRPHFQAPLTVKEKLPANVNAGILGPGGGAPPHPGDWVLSSNTLTTADQPYNPARFINCNQVPGNASAKAAQKAIHACMAHIQAYVAQLREVITYQPAGRYWPFQWYETAIFLALTVILAGICFWWTRHRLT